MDRKDPGKDVSEEVTRESLIALSYAEPENEPAATNSTEKSTGDNVVEAMKADREDTYRSKLISISYTQSPDTQPLPVSPDDVKG